MTTTGYLSATRDETAPTSFSRVAAASSLLLGTTIVGVIHALAEAAFYVGVLAAVSASLTLVAGYVLWSHATMVVRAMAAFGAGATLAGLLLQLLGALPGTGGVGRLMRWEGVVAFLLSAAVVVFLLLDARRRRPEDSPDRPYAL